MSDLRVASLRGRKVRTSPSLLDGAVITGIATATSLSGDGSGLIDATALKDSGGNVKVQGNTSGVSITGVATATQFSGNITGTTGTFSGNVSVGKTLTYEDVTNIDSVGVVTARAGIKIGAGQSVSAVSGIVTYYGDGSQLSGIELGTQSFVASGTIANGATVIVNTDGTVGIVTQTTVDLSSGTPAVFKSAQCLYISSAYDDNSGKVVVAYWDLDNDNGEAVVGTVSGTSISFGSPVTFNSGTTPYIGAAFDSTNNKVVIVYKGSSGYGRARVGTVSGTSISFGSESVYESANSTYNSVVNIGGGKVVIAYRDEGNSNYGTAIVGTVSGTSISFGSAAVFESAAASYFSPTYDSTNGKVVIAYRDDGNYNYGTAIVGTVSGTSISFGSAAVFNNSGNTVYINAVYDSTNDKVVIAYRDLGNGGYGTAIVGTVSGTSISFGSEVLFHSGSSSYVSATYIGSGKLVVAYQDQINSSYGTAIEGTVSGTSISFGTAVVFESANSIKMSAVYDSTNSKVVIAYEDKGNSNYGTGVVLSPGSTATNLTSENYIGIAAEAISNGATGKINVVAGTNSGQTGLTTAQTYYVQPNGTLATSAGSPSVVAGTSISDTKIIVQKS